MWQCITVCPAASPVLNPMLYPVGVEILLNDHSALIDKAEQCQPLIGWQREEIGSVPVREHEQVALAGGKTVPAGIAELILCNNIIRKGLAERAFRGFHAG